MRDPICASRSSTHSRIAGGGRAHIEKLSYKGEPGSKGHLSTLEKGLARPTIQTLQVIADRLEVKLLDLVTFPEEDDCAKLIDRTCTMTTAEVRRLLKNRRK